MVRATVLTRGCVREDVPTSVERAGGFRPAGRAEWIVFEKKRRSELEGEAQLRDSVR
jgi:hypothetical protein